MSNKKQLSILLAVTIGLTSFLAGYLFIRPSRDSAAILQQQRGALIDRFSGLTDGSTPTPLPPGLLQATTDSSLAPINAADANSILYYHRDSGYVSKLDLETRLNTLISSTQLIGLSDVVWSPNKNRVITVSRNSLSSVYKYFDYTTREHGTLGNNIKDAVFSTDSQKIAILRSVNSDGVIEISDFTGKNPRSILKTRLNNIKLSWPNNNILSFTANDNDTGSQSLYTVSENGNLSQLVEGLDTLSVRWSPDGTKFLYSNKENGGTTLRLFDITLNKARTLPIQTSATNCAWLLDQTSVVCAVESGGETFVDKISLSDWKVKILFSNLIISPQNVFMSHLEDFLVIISASDQSIWELKL